jgi:hypothetical protein
MPILFRANNTHVDLLNQIHRLGVLLNTRPLQMRL